MILLALKTKKKIKVQMGPNHYLFEKNNSDKTVPLENNNKKNKTRLARKSFICVCILPRLEEVYGVTCICNIHPSVSGYRIENDQT